VGVINGAPHPEAARRLAAFLQQRQATERLLAAAALEGVSAGAVATPTLKVDWTVLMKDLERTTAKLNEIFLR
jgi:ABC-type Fe3+ transport system substrate-binding protein